MNSVILRYSVIRDIINSDPEQLFNRLRLLARLRSNLAFHHVVILRHVNLGPRRQFFYWVAYILFNIFWTVKN
jgi:hypothetical protein